MKLTPQEKADRTRQRMLDKACEYSLGTYARRVAAIFQRMIRAEAAALPKGLTPAIVDGQVRDVFRLVGQCACVTCGKVTSWKGGLDRYGGIHAGHFLASRRNSILFEEDNTAPQCAHCNVFRHGQPQAFRMWMAAVRGQETIERLERLKTGLRQFTREELVDMKIAFMARLKGAENLIEEG